MKQYIDIEFTLDLNDEQQDFTLEYIDAARRGGDAEAGYEVQRHGCGELSLYITEDGEPIAEAEFTPETARNFVREVGQHWHDNGRLEAPEQNALHHFQLAASYADGEITKKEVRELQDEFEDSHDFVMTGMNSLQFRKDPYTEENQ